MIKARHYRNRRLKSGVFPFVDFRTEEKQDLRFVRPASSSRRPLVHPKRSERRVTSAPTATFGIVRRALAARLKPRLESLGKENLLTPTAIFEEWMGNGRRYRSGCVLLNGSREFSSLLAETGSGHCD